MEDHVETVEQETPYICDRCKREYDDILETQEFLHYRNYAGYSSVFGDGNILRLDLCQHCVKALLNDYIHIEGNYIWGSNPNIM